MQHEINYLRNMEPKIGDRMKVSPQLTDQPDWIDGEVIVRLLLQVTMRLWSFGVAPTMWDI